MRILITGIVIVAIIGGYAVIKHGGFFIPGITPAAFSESSFESTCLWVDGLVESIHSESTGENAIRLKQQIKSVEREMAGIRSRSIDWELSVFAVSPTHIHVNNFYAVFNGEVLPATGLSRNPATLQLFAAIRGDRVTPILLVVAKQKPGLISFPIDDTNRNTAANLRQGDPIRVTGILEKVDANQNSILFRMSNLQLKQ